MQVIKLASSTEFATKIRKVSNFCTEFEVIHFKLEALAHASKKECNTIIVGRNFAMVVVVLCSNRMVR